MGCLAELLKRGGRSARWLWGSGADAQSIIDAPEALGRARNIVVNCPPKTRGGKLSLEDIAQLAMPEARIYLCGPSSPEAGDARFVDLWRDEALLRDNARFTAEGALASVMRAGSRCLRDTRCLVVGWGRIGQALTEQLTAMGAGVAVASRSGEHRRRAMERGAEAVPTGDMGDALGEADAVFVTAPAMVLDRERLERVRTGAMIVDLASPPYGVDVHAAWGLGLRAWREPGLPGRYCPESAALALMRAIERDKKGEREDG